LILNNCIQKALLALTGRDVTRQSRLPDHIPAAGITNFRDGQICIYDHMD